MNPLKLGKTKTTDQVLIKKKKNKKINKQTNKQKQKQNKQNTEHLPN